MADIKMINNYNIKDETARNEIENLRGEIPINVSELNNDAGYLTEHQDISHLALKSEIPEVPSIEGLATEQYVNDAIANIEIPEVDTSNLATKDELNNALGDIESLLGRI